MTTEQKFNAAVNVIKSLPKNGSYQPSTDLMLRFYAYFKQSTQGPCKGSRPGFWDIVGRAKYDAWKNLGNMPKSEAMTKYVDELHTIVETMSYSDKVASFLDAPSNELDNINMEDLQLVVGDVIERVRSQPNSPLASRESSPNRLISSIASSSSRSTSAGRADDDSDFTDGEYVDTIESPPEPRKNIPNGYAFPELTNGHHTGHKSRSRSRNNVVDISPEISVAIQSIKNDLDKLHEKVNHIEKHNKSSTTSTKHLVKRTKLPFGISMQLLAFIVAWPFLAQLIMNRFFRKH